MKKLLLASTAAATFTAALAVIGAGQASAQGVTVFGDARLGFGYNVVRNGDVVPDDIDTLDEDELRAISRVRFGVRMSGETDTGITFGATIRADNAAGGAGSGGQNIGNTGGSVFVSGAFGTLTYGDIASAHQQHTGDLPELGLTGLGFNNEPPYLGNRVGGADSRPTVRYDFDAAGFGISLSTNNEFDEIGVGASFSPQFGGGAFTIGGGYIDVDGNNQWSAAIGGAFAGFNAQVIYTNADNEIVDGFGTETLGFGIGTTFADIGINAFYHEGFGSGASLFDGTNAYGAGFTFGLGNGASLRGGVVNTFGGTTAADLGIQMSF